MTQAAQAVVPGSAQAVVLGSAQAVGLGSAQAVVLGRDTSSTGSDTSSRGLPWGGPWLSFSHAVPVVVVP